MKNSDTRSQENFLSLLGEGGKTELISLNPVMGVEPLQEIILHLEVGGGNASPTLNPSNDTELLNENVSPSVEVGVGNELPTSNLSSGVEPFQNSDTIGNMDDPNRILNVLRAKNSERLVIGHININSIENKFDSLASLVKDKVDIIMISETKIDDSSPQNQFLMEGYSVPFRLDRNSVGGGIMIYIRDDIPCKELKSYVLPEDVEGIFIEINIRKVKWVLMGGYNLQKESISYFLCHVSYEIDKFLVNYDNILILGGFNSTMSEKPMMDFCEMYNLQNLIKEPTCYKNANNPSSIDVILTNRKSSFQNSMAIETGLSDHHKMTITVLKLKFKKKEPITIKFRSYKHFDEYIFRNNLLKNLQDSNKETMSYDDFKEIFMKVLNLYAPMKKKIVRGNNAPFMNKNLLKAFMHRSKLKNKYNKNPTEPNKLLYKKQRNICVNLLKKEKKKYYNNLDENI